MTRRALEGIRVLEFTVAIAGPTAGKYLAHHGAEVILVEATKRTAIGAYVSRRLPGLVLMGRGDLTVSRDEYNAGKLSLGLNMDHPKGRELFVKLVGVSDVILSNYSVKAYRSLGLDYEVLKEINPGIILVLASGFGLTGPYWNHMSWGPNLEAVVGIRHLSTHPGAPPAGTGISLPDYIGAYHITLGIVCALIHRQRTGQGQLIDLSQFEAAAGAIGPSIMDYAVNGHNQGPWANRLSYAAPHGVYRCRGEDRWVALSVFTDQEWQGFHRALGNPTWAADPRFATLAGRKEHEDELDGLVEASTRERDAYDIMFALQKEGVAAGVVQSCEDLLYRDRHIWTRQFFPVLNHTVKGKVMRTGFALRLLGTPGKTTRGGPLHFEHNDYVCGEILGLSAEEIRTLVEEGAIEGPIGEVGEAEYFKEEHMLAAILR